MISVLEGKANSILLEPPGLEGIGVEFCVKTDTFKEYHQVKRQNSGYGRWSLSALKAKRVLSHCYDKLTDESAHFVFVSSHAAHPLDELVVRARKAQSFKDFEENFITPVYSRDLEKLEEYWKTSSRREVFQLLKRIYVTTEDEAALHARVLLHLALTVTGNADTIISVLSDLALRGLHQEVNSAYLWEHLEKNGFKRQDGAQNPSVRKRITELDKGYLVGIQPVGIAGQLEYREVTDHILAYFDDEQTGNIVLVTGKAGVGKSSVIAQVIEKIQERSMLFLALRIDHLDPCPTPTDIGSQLGLPAAPDSVLLNLAKDKECMLVIDQLDAISLVSGRNPNFFNCIGHLIERSKDFPNLKVLAACRKFDIENDSRLRRLIGEERIGSEFPVDEFNVELTSRVVNRMGIDATKLSQSQMNLLSTPLHLRILSELTLDNRLRISDLQSAKVLFDHFWDQKDRAWRAASPLNIRCMKEAIRTLTVHMSQCQSLSAPMSILDDHEGALDVLISENILVKNGSKVSFFHESFFDYMFAREEVSSDFNLQAFVLQREQSLFLRSQLRQILPHLRDFDYPKTISGIRDILANEKIRSHLKAFVLTLVGSLSTHPKRAEWKIIAQYLHTDLSSYAWGAISWSPHWFDLMERLGVIQQWLESGSGQDTTRALELMRSVHKVRADHIAAILAPLLNRSEALNARLKSFIAIVDLTVSKHFLEFVIKAVRCGVLDNYIKPTDRNLEVWDFVQPLVKAQPVWACEFIAAVFKRLLFLIGESVQGRELFWFEADPYRTGSEIVFSTAQAAPKPFFETMWPILIEILAVFGDQEGSPPRRDSVWRYPADSANYRTDLTGKLLAAIELAWRKLVEEEPNALGSYSEILLNSQYLTLQYLLMRGYAACGKHYAHEAAAYLLEFPESRLISEDPMWRICVVGPLLKAITPYCSLDQLLSMEETVLGYSPSNASLSPMDREDNDGRSAQLQLLNSFESSRLSDRGLRRLQELRRKITLEPEGDQPRTMTGWVGPAIPESSLVKMSNDGWLDVMKRYPQPSIHIGQDGTPVGGSLQISRILESMTKQNPSRFVELIHDIPDDTHHHYFVAILRGITGSNLSAETVIAACHRCHRIPFRPVGLDIARTLGAISSAPLPQEALELVAWYATEDPDPGSHSRQVALDHNANYSEKDLLYEGINTVRGVASLNVGNLIVQDPTSLGFFERVLPSMVRDSSPGVRACVADALLRVLRHDRDLAVDLFLKLCDTDERLLVTAPVKKFLRCSGPTHFKQLEPLLSRMINSTDEAVATAGALQICLSSLDNEAALRLGRFCINGSAALRLGAAEVFATNVKWPQFRARCEKMLVSFFSDSDAQVRRESARCFCHFEGNDVEQFQSLADAFMDSLAFKQEHRALFESLKQSTANVPDTILKACERLIGLADENLSTLDFKSVVNLADVIALVLRVYSKAEDAETQRRCLDLIDSLTLKGTFGLEHEFAAFDR